MNTVILLVIWMVHTGEVYVAQEGEDSATVMTLTECKTVLKNRLDEARGHSKIKWAIGGCIPLDNTSVPKLNNNFI